MAYTYAGYQIKHKTDFITQIQLIQTANKTVLDILSNNLVNVVFPLSSTQNYQNENKKPLQI